jgi:chloramphenicol 3-O-phosphotransferase
MIGLARGQFGLVHNGKDYDFTVDTTTATAMDCAMAIKEALRL